MTAAVPENITLKNKIGESKIGEVDYGETWEAFDRSKKKKLVLKSIKTSCTNKADTFQNEVAVWEQLRSDGAALPAVTLNGQDENGFWYTREFVAGQSWAESKIYKENAAVKKITALANFIAQLHSKGLTHRNLKPSNIFEAGGGAVAVDADFGGFRSPDGIWSNDVKSLAQLLAFLLTGQMPDSISDEQIPEACRLFVAETRQNPPASIAEFRSGLDRIEKVTRASVFAADNAANTSATNNNVTNNTVNSDSTLPQTDSLPEGAVCPQCRIPVQATAANRVCPQCGRSYLEPCLNCQALNLFWVKTCRSCGGDLAALKQKLYATLNTQKQMILKFRESYGHEKTLPLLKYMSTVSHPDFLAFKEWAKKMALLIQKERKDIKVYVDSIRVQAAAAMKSQKYDRVQQILDQVPHPLLDDPLRQLYNEAGETMKEVDSLVKEIRNALSTKQYSQLLSCVQRYLELKANDPEAQNLQKKIEKLTTITSTKGMKFRRIPGGKFYMGSHDSDEYLRNNEHPQHRVVIPHNLFIGVYQVTQKEFFELMEFNPSTSVENENCPADSVTWYSAVEFCNKMGALESFSPFYDLKSVKRRANGSIEKAEVTILGGDGYRLPTEAEWEHACRAGSITPWSFGDQVFDVDTYAWYFDNSSMETHPVGGKKPNSWGLYDMHGNVMEWCHDWYEEFFYLQCPEEEENPPGPAEGTSKVLRGGAWQFGAEATRCAYRNSSVPDTAAAVIGFRVCRNANDEVL
ncbi:MAG: SUMF1/EgtB/PvdO family nonheme iron enzyme [Planctomycetaceae bacterium]|jgi:formylglycine-generating enzyme required for sulfatase activity/serine/threonine protein kinase|nr:SUMF1/EgtB/PvdO family nonheme iron enzyme [Planctomycetaceae bacterium]